MKKRGVYGSFSSILLLLLLVFLSGCQGQETGPTQPEGPYVGGNAGLTFAFQEDEPPNEVLDDRQQEFYITLLLRNLGEYTIPVGGVVASLSGIDKNAFDLPSLTTINDVEIQGVTKDQTFVIPGAEELVEFPSATYVNDIPADFLVTVRADVCYQYKTQAVTNLCLKQNVREKTVEDVCEINVPDLAMHNSGAPLQITNARQTSVGSNKVKLSFTVANVAKGLVYLPGTFSNSCSGKESNRDKVIVRLSNPQNNFNIDCSTLGGGSNGEVRLVGQQKEVSCVINTGNLQEVTFQDIVLIEVDYIYREAVTTPLRVLNAV